MGSCRSSARKVLEPGLQLASPLGIEPHADGEERERGPVPNSRWASGARRRQACPDVVLAVGEEHDGRSGRVCRQVGRRLIHRLHVVRVGADLADDRRIGAPPVLPGRQAEAVRELLDRSGIGVERQVLAPGKPAARLANGTSEMTAFPFTRSSRVTSTRSAMSSSAFANWCDWACRSGWSSRSRARPRRPTGSAGPGDAGRDADGHEDDGHRAPDARSSAPRRRTSAAEERITPRPPCRLD